MKPSVADRRFCRPQLRKMRKIRTSNRYFGTWKRCKQSGIYLRASAGREAVCWFGTHSLNSWNCHRFRSLFHRSGARLSSYGITQGDIHVHRWWRSRLRIRCHKCRIWKRFHFEDYRDEYVSSLTAYLKDPVTISAISVVACSRRLANEESGEQYKKQRLGINIRLFFCCTTPKLFPSRRPDWS